MRNLVVHNNAIADKDEAYTIGDLNVTLIRGKMTRGKLDFFVNLVEHSIESYNTWINNLVKHGNSI